MLMQKSIKKGHRRQISKQLIKRRLMEDLYPIPRQKDMNSRVKMKSALNMKFTNTLQFLQYNQVQELMLQKFQEKLQHELEITIPFLQMGLQNVRIDSHIYNTIKKLVGFDKKTLQMNEDQLLYSLKNLSLTARQQIKAIIKLLLFYYFFRVNIKEYKTVLRQFAQKNIFMLTQTMAPGRTQLIISKILSSIYTILIKFNQTQQIVKIGKKVISHRKDLQKKYFNSQNLQITKQHVRTTLFFKIKYFQSLLKHQKDPYEIMNILHDELLQMKKRPIDGHISNDIFELYIQEIMKIKSIVEPRIVTDFYHAHHSEEKVIENSKNRDKVQTAIKQFKRRKSLNFGQNYVDISSSKDNESLKSFQEDKNIKIKGENKFRRIYNPSSKQQIQKLSKYTSQGTLKKSRKNLTQSLFRQTSQSAINTAKVNLKIVQQLSKQTVDSKLKSISKQKQVNPHLFLKLNSLFQITKKYMNKHDEKQMKIEKMEKKRKIEQIYQNFTNLNKIVREIPWRQLDKQCKFISKAQIGFKHEIKQIYSAPIIKFSDGILNKNNEISTILNNKGCLQLQFMKLWLGQLYTITLKIQLQDQKFILNVHLNDSRFNIVLNRGSNVLCERYVTIWPTIRYLVNKRLYQFSIFKRYEGLLLIKKMTEANLMLLQSEFYQDKFGFISKEEIEEINICLDSVFKILMISRHYYGKSFHKQLVKINEEFYFPFQITSFKEDVEFMKINLLSQIFLFTHSKITLITFGIILQEKYFLVEVQINRQALINVMKNRQQLQIILSITNFTSMKTKIQNKIIIQWFDLEQQMILYQDFRSYVLSICTDRAKNKKIPSIMIQFFRKRLILKYHPIFSWEVEFKKNQIAETKQNTQKICTLNDFPYKRYKIQAVENYCQAHIPSEKQIKLDNINKTNKQQNPKKGANPKNLKIWKQQRRISNHQYLLILQLADEPITQQWVAQILIINRKSKTKNKILFNQLDLNIIKQNDQIKVDQKSNKSLITCTSPHHLTGQVYSSLIDLMNNISFHWNYQLSRPFFAKNGVFYRYNLRQQLHLQQMIAKRRQNKSIQSLTAHPLLQKFTKYCHMRIVKPLKVKSQFCFLTLRQNFIEDNSFWQIILQFPRKHTHYACFLRQQSMIFYISDHHRKQNQCKLFDSSLSLSHFSRFQENLTISMNHADQQEVINYKKRILNLCSRNQIQVYEKNKQYFIKICDDEYQLHQRIISQFQPSQRFIYNVWVNEERIQIDVHSYGGDFDVSNSSFTDSELFNDYKKQFLGSIELPQAFRFYEMENKDTNQDEDYLKRVCKFYFQCVKQQRVKQMIYLKSKQSEKDHKDDYYF